MSATLVATIGTRDLAYQVTEGSWLSVGNDRPVAGNEAPATQVARDLASLLESPEPLKTDFRSLTQAIRDRFEVVQDRLQPIVIGQFIADRAADLESIYLIATDQVAAKESHRQKDTCYCAEIFQRWIESKYSVPTRILYLGQQGENPSDFDAMLRWCKQQVWQPIEAAGQLFDTVYISPKGGVGQTSEALRVTALGQYGDRQLLFLDFQEEPGRNRQGQPSPYSLSKGQNYLWELRQREALALLGRYDYAGIQQALQPYRHEPVMIPIQQKLDALTQWNMVKFDRFAEIIGGTALERSKEWWWIGYEAAYLAATRLEQGNIVEAFFHSFRAVESLVSQWAEHSFPEHVIPNNDSPLLKASVLEQYPDYLGKKKHADWRSDLQSIGTLRLSGFPLYALLRCDRKSWKKECKDLSIFTERISPKRNKLFHRLRGLEPDDFLQAWEVNSYQEWEARILLYLNFIAQQSFTSLAQASLMSQVYAELKTEIEKLQAP